MTKVKTRKHTNLYCQIFDDDVISSEEVEFIYEMNAQRLRFGAWSYETSGIG